MKLIAFLMTSAVLGVLALANPGDGSDLTEVVAEARPGQVIAGHAELGEDGRLVIDGMAIELMGLKLPARGQVCQDRIGAAFGCGQEARAYLDRHQQRDPVHCLVEATELGPRGRCSLGDSDLSAMLVHSGLAWAETSAVPDYVELQNGARADARGLWR